MQDLMYLSSRPYYQYFYHTKIPRIHFTFTYNTYSIINNVIFLSRKDYHFAPQFILLIKRMDIKLKEWSKSGSFYLIFKNFIFYFIININSKMQQLMKELQTLVTWKQSMRKTCRINKLNIDIASHFTPLRFRAIYAKFHQIYERKGQEKGERWVENELKAFYWVCVAISCTSDLRISTFTSQELSILSRMFHFKQPITIEYEIKKLNDQSQFKHDWQPAEEHFLKQIVKKQQGEANKWNEFARQLFELSKKVYFRTGKQCRQRWLNHLDPDKDHGEWNQEEDRRIIELYLSDGRKWSQIARKLGNKRTQHMIKNRYKAILTKQKRKHPRIKSQSVLIKSFLNIKVAEKHYLKLNAGEVVLEAEKRVQNKQAEEKMLQQLQEEQDEAQQQLDEQAYLVEKARIQEQEKNVPQTSSAFQLPHVYSPWMYYNHIPMTPTFSPSIPFYINLSSFSVFQANISNQFYNHKPTTEKPEPS